jgi:hypothetical protein
MVLPRDLRRLHKTPTPEIGIVVISVPKMWRIIAGAISEPHTASLRADVTLEHEIDGVTAKERKELTERLVDVGAINLVDDQNLVLLDSFDNRPGLEVEDVLPGTGQGNSLLLFRRCPTDLWP